MATKAHSTAGDTSGKCGSSIRITGPYDLVFQEVKSLQNFKSSTKLLQKTFKLICHTVPQSNPSSSDSLL